MVEAGNSQTSDAREALMHMFLENYDMLSGFLYSKVEDWELVEEALQETTVYLCSHWNDYTPGTNFRAWIRVIARHRCQELLWQKRRVRNLVKSDLQPAEISIVDEKWDDFGTKTPTDASALDPCLNALPERHRQIIEMYYLEGKSGAQLAAFLDKSIDATYLTIGRIRKRLKECLERRLAKESE